MSGSDIIKYATEQFVRYLDYGSKKHRLNKQTKSFKDQSGYYDRWFGVLPFLIKTALKLQQK